MSSMSLLLRFAVQQLFVLIVLAFIFFKWYHCYWYQQPKDHQEAQELNLINLRTVPTNSRVFFRGLLNIREKQISLNVIKIQKENWGQPSLKWNDYAEDRNFNNCICMTSFKLKAFSTRRVGCEFPCRCCVRFLHIISLRTSNETTRTGGQGFFVGDANEV